MDDMNTATAAVAHAVAAHSGTATGLPDFREAAMILGLSDAVVCSASGLRTDYDLALSGSPIPKATVGLQDEEADINNACLFLAAKLCEEPRRMRDIINATHLAVSATLLTDSRQYWRMKEGLLIAEQRLLRSMAYAAKAPQTHVLLLNCLRAIRVNHDLYELSLSIMNDCAICASGSNPQNREYVAAVIFLGATLLGDTLPISLHELLEVNEGCMASICHAVLDQYEPQRNARCD